MDVRAIAHITGGGLTENLPRVLPAGSRAVINRNSWPRPPVFGWLQQAGNVDPKEMLRTFNCGIGMIVCVPTSEAQNTLSILEDMGEQGFVIGTIAKGQTGAAPLVEYTE